MYIQVCHVRTSLAQYNQLLPPKQCGIYKTLQVYFMKLQFKTNLQASFSNIQS